MKEEIEGNPIGKVIKIAEARMRDDLGEMLRVTVDETFNASRPMSRSLVAGFYDRSQPSAAKPPLSLQCDLHLAVIIEEFSRRAWPRQSHAGFTASLCRIS